MSTLRLSGWGVGAGGRAGGASGGASGGAVGALVGRFRPPGDKSVSHRAVILGALADGRTEISGFLPGADCLSTIDVYSALGAEVAREGDHVSVTGAGLDGLRRPTGALDVGNSGTTIRLTLGVLAGQSFESRITGDASIRRRPMGRVAEPLRLMGADVRGTEGDLAPLSVRGGPLRPIDYRTPVASAQVKSAVLLAGLYADGVTRLTEPARSRDHTERLLRHFGVDVDAGGLWVAVRGGQRLSGQSVVVPGDISSAAYFLAAAAVIPGSEVTAEGLGVNPTRAAVLDVLGEIGARVELAGRTDTGGEPLADVTVACADLRPFEVRAGRVPNLIDDLVILAVIACAIPGESTIRGARELRVKESDRIAALSAGLRAFGADVEEFDDGLAVRGGVLTGAECDAGGDHRMAMAFAVAGLLARGETAIHGAECIDVSYPGFAGQLQELSGAVRT